MTQVELPPLQIESKARFKLTKNTKGYSWEITCPENDIDKAFTETCRINDLAIEKFGSQE